MGLIAILISDVEKNNHINQGIVFENVQDLHMILWEVFTQLNIQSYTSLTHLILQCEANLINCPPAFLTGSDSESVSQWIKFTLLYKTLAHDGQLAIMTKELNELT